MIKNLYPQFKFKCWDKKDKLIKDVVALDFDQSYIRTRHKNTISSGTYYNSFKNTINDRHMIMGCTGLKYKDTFIFCQDIITIDRNTIINNTNNYIKYLSFYIKSIDDLILINPINDSSIITTSLEDILYLNKNLEIDNLYTYQPLKDMKYSKRQDRYKEFKLTDAEIHELESNILVNI